MAVVYKKISELDSATLPLDGGAEYVPIVQSGASRKALWSGIFGAGWWTKLKAAYSAFVAPEATHASDADTLASELPADFHDAAQLTGTVPLASIPADFHDAAQLTGTVPLASIPAELTGKNAATASSAAALSGCGFFGYNMGGTLPSGGTFLVIRVGRDTNIIDAPPVETDIYSTTGGVSLSPNYESHIHYAYAYFRLTN